MGSYRADRHGPIPADLVGLIWPRPLGPHKPPKSKTLCRKCGAGSRSDTCGRCRLVCVRCGGQCTQLRSGKPRCLPCYQSSHRIKPVICAGCGETFIRRKGNITAKYCSRECAFAHQRDWMRRPAPKVKTVHPRPCFVCGKERPVKRFRYCSDTCRSSREKKAIRRISRTPVACVLCGAPGPGRSMCCSKRCWRRLRKYSQLWSGLKGHERAEMIATAVALKRFNQAYNDVFIQKGLSNG
jgi:predicted nucleic acid-binding Zn ribbon protein